MSITYNERVSRKLCARCGRRQFARGVYCEACYLVRKRHRLAAAARHPIPDIAPRSWTPEETERALALRALGREWADIGAALGRTEWSVKNHINKQLNKEDDVTLRGIANRASLKPYPGVARCKCGLSLPCNSCLAKNVTEHVEKNMRRPSP